jgi:hypothetical protein
MVKMDNYEVEIKTSMLIVIGQTAIHASIELEMQ